LVTLLLVTTTLATGCVRHTPRDDVESAVRAYLDAFASRDTAALAASYDSSCHVSAAELRKQFDAFGDQPLAVDVTGVDVQMESSTTANAIAHGTLTVGGRSFPLTGSSGTGQFHLIDEHGRWRIANCPGTVARVDEGRLDAVDLHAIVMRMSHSTSHWA
jgi:hypothetical protein